MISLNASAHEKKLQFSILPKLGHRLLSVCIRHHPWLIRPWLREIVTQNLVDLFPNVFISLRIFMTLPISAADAERSFSNQKRTKNYLRSTMGQQRLNGLAMLSINSDIARTLNYQSVIEKFVALKIRRMIWNFPLSFWKIFS